MNEYKPVVKQGVTMAIISILIFVIIYAIDPMFFAQPKGWIITIGVNIVALPVVFMILGARDCKPNFTPYKFGNAFNAAFFTTIVASLILLVFNVIFITIIDTSWEGELQEAALESTTEFMESMGANDADIEVAIEKAEVRMEKAPKGAIAQLYRTGQMLVWYAILALIIGAVQKDKKQEDLVE